MCKKIYYFNVPIVYLGYWILFCLLNKIEYNIDYSGLDNYKVISLKLNKRKLKKVNKFIEQFNDYVLEIKIQEA